MAGIMGGGGGQPQGNAAGYPLAGGQSGTTPFPTLGGPTMGMPQGGGMGGGMANPLQQNQQTGQLMQLIQMMRSYGL
jgi:hypothetical protein